ncbi:RNA-directed DNA polymerase [Planococcus lenghuensis]|uniref:Reverse transcriptase domain-containing protein n=1 Tax=Planococcus lenghuensis TaxID=2213202 RepID=A0A1Q2KVJ4_9BACL|nr:RNA-directed DNA polymerase [Planococcus lenghuensis]AQQ52238.1 hypothetical protein B0X71_03340 [Planococcus lenghuensis]
MLNDSLDIPMLTLRYGESLSKSKLYNPQTISILNLIKKNENNVLLNELEKGVEEFCEDNTLHISRDFVYKNDYFTPRNMHLISPLYYLYYTKIVFEIARSYLNGMETLNFSSKRLKSFYSGRLEFSLDKEKVSENSNFNSSYKHFQKEREKYFGHPALKIDLKDFFSSIKVVNLKEKLEKHIGRNPAIDDLVLFYSFCGFSSLPQFHYSIASSILSQFYLQDFDNKMKSLLDEEELILIRFVDDMFIIPEDKTVVEKRNNTLLQIINHWLWEDELVLNSSKTKLLSAEEYEIDFQTLLDYEENNSFLSEKKIEEQAKEIISNGNFKYLLLELNKLEKDEGVNLSAYKSLTDEYVSIGGEDTYKIINNIIYSRKWEMMNDKDLIEIIKKWKYVLYNPSQFTVLYVMICRYLENRSKVDGSPIRKLLNYLLRRDNFTFRDTLVAAAYLFQNKKKHSDLLDKISAINNDYVKFMKMYISD